MNNPILIGAIIACLTAIFNLFLWVYILRKAGFPKLLKDTLTLVIKEQFSLPLAGFQQQILIVFDDFMANKLTQKMPVLSMFIDEKLIDEIRVVFHAEMEESLPILIQNALKNEQNTENLDEVIDTISSFLMKKLRKPAILIIALSIVFGAILGEIVSLFG